MIKASIIPTFVTSISTALKGAGYEAYLVGGCVRDSIMGITPKDWDITTNATPEQIQHLFADTYYENTFGTVGIIDRNEDGSARETVEVTPYRTEGKYSDNRRPDSVSFGTSLEEDLQRRDFTMNALAYDLDKGQIIDLYGGIKDIQAKTVRAVGDAGARFQEDALRMMRAVRFCAQLSFTCNYETLSAIQNNVNLLTNISRERIRDEFNKIIMSPDPMHALMVMEKVGMIEHICPVLRETVGVEQNKQAHKYTVWEHLLRTLQHAADKDFSLEIRLAALFHDISKPYTLREVKDASGRVVDCTFYGHEVVGARVTRETLTHLKYPGETVDYVSKLVRWHMFFSSIEQITLSAVRRLVANVGEDAIWDLMKLRQCDRIGSGRPTEDPYRLRKYKSMIEEALRDPVSVAMLAIGGEDVIRETQTPAGRTIGLVLNALLGEVFDDPQKNTREFLVKRAKELVTVSDETLRALSEAGKNRRNEEDERILSEIRSKYKVK